MIIMSIQMIKYTQIMIKIWLQNRRMKLKKELRAVKEINEQERKKRDEPGEHYHPNDHHDDKDDDNADLDPHPDHDWS